MPERALFLIDGPNFYKNMRPTGLKRKHLDYQKLAQLLAQERTIVDVILFTSPVVRHVLALGKTVFQVRPNRSRGAGLGAECNKTLIIIQTHIDAAQAF